MKTTKRFLLLGIAHALAFTMTAGLPQPDNLVYGTISFPGFEVTSTNQNYSVEARRTLLGAPVATYRMGASPEAGKFFYVLRLLVESTPATTLNASEIGSTLLIVVKDDAGGVRAQKTLQLTAAG